MAHRADGLSDIFEHDVTVRGNLIVQGEGFVNDILNTVYPVGAVYISVVSTSPATLFGGTWSSFGAGKVLVGLDSGDTDFDTVEETGGAKTHTLTQAEMPAHTHAAAQGADFLTTSGAINTANGLALEGRTASPTNTASAGGGGSHNNLQPYIVVYMWKRTA